MRVFSELYEYFEKFTNETQNCLRENIFRTSVGVLPNVSILDAKMKNLYTDMTGVNPFGRYYSVLQKKIKLFESLNVWSIYKYNDEFAKYPPKVPNIFIFQR